MRSLLCLILIILSSNFCSAQILIYQAAPLSNDSNGFPIHSADSGLQVISYVQSYQHYGHQRESIDSVYSTDSTITFRCWDSFDWCHHPTYYFSLSIDSFGILRISKTVYDDNFQICQGVASNSFTIICRKTNFLKTDIKGVGYAYKSTFVPLPVRPVK